MECPNCREIENGVWRCFENGSPEPDLYEGMDEEPVDFIDMVKAKTTYNLITFVPIYSFLKAANTYFSRSFWLALVGALSNRTG